MGQHQQPVQRLRRVLEPDARLVRVGPAVRADEFADDALLPVQG
ncbi:hypothetical protein ABZ016_07830 [Streptomyces sp. NPDC006372]